MNEEVATPCIQDRIKSIILNKFYVRFIFLLLILISLFFIAECLGFEVFFNREVLKLLVSVEATILGFYGLIFTYILNALDTKQNRYEDQQSLIKRVRSDRYGLQGRLAVYDPVQQKRVQELELLKLGLPEEKRLKAQIDHFNKVKKYIRITFIFTFSSLVLSMLIALLLISLKAEWGTIVNELCLFRFLSLSLLALFINSFINFLLLIYEWQELPMTLKR